MLTPYGPGKFDLLIDELAYCASLDGSTEDFGDYSEFGFITSLVPMDGTERITGMSAEDIEFVSKQRACIVTENDQGSVYVDWFESEEAARELFAQNEETWLNDQHDDE